MADPRLIPPRRAALSLTSLIDVIFLLLLFFMLTSTFARLGEIELTGAAQGAGQPQSAPPVFVRLGPESLTVNSVETPLEALRAELTTRAGEGLVLIALSDGVEAQRLVDVLAVLSGAAFALRVLE